LNGGLHYRDIRTCEGIFNECCCIHNLMLDQMERNCVRVSHGAPIGTDGIWLDGNVVETEATDVIAINAVCKRRSLLAKHLLVLRKKGPFDVN